MDVFEEDLFQVVLREGEAKGVEGGQSGHAQSCQFLARMENGESVQFFAHFDQGCGQTKSVKKFQ